MPLKIILEDKLQQNETHRGTVIIYEIYLQGNRTKAPGGREEEKRSYKGKEKTESGKVSGQILNETVSVGRIKSCNYMETARGLCKEHSYTLAHIAIPHLQIQPFLIFFSWLVFTFVLCNWALFSSLQKAALLTTYIIENF